MPKFAVYDFDENQNGPLIHFKANDLEHAMEIAFHVVMDKHGADANFLVFEKTGTWGTFRAAGLTCDCPNCAPTNVH